MTTHTGRSDAVPGTAPPDSRKNEHMRDFARGGLVGLAGSVIAAAGGFILTIAVARTLGPAQTGVFFSVVAFFMILTEVTELGADTGLVRSGARLLALGRVGDLRRVLIAALVPVLLAGVIAAVLVFALAPWLAGLITDPAHQDDAEFFLRVCAPFLAVSAARNVALSGTRGLGDVMAFSVQANILTPLSRPVLIIGTALFGYGAGAVMVAWSAPLGVTFVVAVVILWRLLRRAESAAPAGAVAPAADEPSAVREFWHFSSLRGVAAMLEIVIVWLGVPIVAMMASSHDAGVYATASRFITTGTLLLAATRIAIAPQISAMLARGEHREAEDLNAVATAWVVVGSWPLYLALAVFGPFVLTLFGDEFADGASAMAVLAVAMAVVLAAGNVQTILLMGGKSTWNLLNKAVVVVVMVVAHLLLVPPFGIVGAAVAWSAAMLLDNLLAVVQVRRLLGLGLRVRAVAPVVVWSLFWYGAVGAAARVLWGTTAVVFAGYLVVATLGYGAVLWRLRRRVLQVDAMLAALRSRRGG